MQAASRHSRVRLGRRVGKFDNGHLFRSLVGHPIPALRLGVLRRKTANGAPYVITTRVDLAGLAVFRGNEIKLLVETAPIANGNRITLDSSQGALQTPLVTVTLPRICTCMSAILPRHYRLRIAEHARSCCLLCEDPAPPARWMQNQQCRVGSSGASARALPKKGLYVFDALDLAGKALCSSSVCGVRQASCIHGPT